MDLTGHRLGHYKIIQEIGRGGMAVVYRAYQTSLNREVAIKVLPQHLGFDRVFVERFQREARASAQLSHPNIVVIYDVGHDQGIYFIVMELLEGRTLKQIIEQEGTLPVQRATRIAQQVASALDYAHGRGFVHRDVKPANIFVGKGDHVTLADFGIAKATAASWQLTSTGALMGTPEYMSPEQAEGTEVDSRSDLYALGIVVYEMLAGRPPFRTDVPLATLYKQVNETPPSIKQQQPHVPQWLAAVVHRALAKRPEDRYQTAEELADALREQRVPRPTQNGHSVKSTPAPTAIRSAVQRLRARAVQPVGTIRILLIALLSVLLVTAGAVALLLTSSDRGGSTPQADPLPSATLPAPTLVSEGGLTPISTQTEDTLSPTETDMPLVPTRTPQQTSTHTATPSRTPAVTTASSESSPTSARPTATSTLPIPTLISPLELATLQGVVRFQWAYSRALGQNQAFQILIWMQGETQHPGAAQSQTEPWQLISLDAVPRLASGGTGEYLWSVVVVDENTDERLSPEATPRRFTYLGPTGQTTPTFTPTATSLPTKVPLLPTSTPTPSDTPAPSPTPTSTSMH